MTESKITASHRRRTAVIYVRQSSVTQVDRNKESTARQYDLVARAHALGWPSSAVSVIDDDLGVSGASHGGAVRVRRASRPGRARAGRDRGGAGVFRGWPATTPTGIGCWTWPG